MCYLMNMEANHTFCSCKLSEDGELEQICDNCALDQTPQRESEAVAEWRADVIAMFSHGSRCNCVECVR